MYRGVPCTAPLNSIHSPASKLTNSFNLIQEVCSTVKGKPRDVQRCTLHCNSQLNPLTSQQTHQLLQPHSGGLLHGEGQAERCTEVYPALQLSTQSTHQPANSPTPSTSFRRFAPR